MGTSAAAAGGQGGDLGGRGGGAPGQLSQPAGGVDQGVGDLGAAVAGVDGQRGPSLGSRGRLPFSLTQRLGTSTSQEEPDESASDSDDQEVDNGTEGTPPHESVQDQRDNDEGHDKPWPCDQLFAPDRTGPTVPASLATRWARTR